MADYHDIEAYLMKAEESLTSAENDLIDQRFNSCANRSYYACLQAAIAALLGEGMRPRGQWGHEFVQAQFAGQLIGRRKRYPSSLRGVLAQNLRVRQRADDEPDPVSRTEGEHSVRRSRGFVAAVRQRTGGGQ